MINHYYSSLEWVLGCLQIQYACFFQDAHVPCKVAGNWEVGITEMTYLWQMYIRNFENPNLTFIG